MFAHKGTVLDWKGSVRAIMRAGSSVYGRLSRTQILSRCGINTYRDNRPMNKLIIGLADKTAALNTKPGFLLIDDGPIADAFLERFKRAKEFNPKSHSFNPLSLS